MASSKRDEEFIQQVQQGQASLLREFWDLFRYNKKWWLTPIVLGLVLVSFMLFLATTAVAPFIYTLF